MFRRRHPYLFFLLVFSAILASTSLGLSILFTFGGRGGEFDFGEKVGVIEIEGLIADAADTVEAIKRFRQDEAVKAIVLRIDSPGGGVGPSQEIYREVVKTVAAKKVVASMGAVAASGGYYVAAAADGIMANPGTITGSIGVIINFANVEQLLQKIGLVPYVIKSGAYKDIGSPVRAMTDDERRMLQTFVNTVHRQFIAAVAESREMAADRVASLADGRIFSGQQAESLGLVDRLGNLEDAIEWAGRLGGIEGKISAVYAREKKMPFLRYLTDASLQMVLERVFNPSLYGGYLYHPSGGAISPQGRSD